MGRKNFATLATLVLASMLTACGSSAPPASTGIVIGDDAGPTPGQLSLAATTTDVTAPSAPSNLAWSNEDMTVTMSWGASTDNVGVVSYDFYYGQYYIGSTDQTSATLIGFKINAPYDFTVKARDAAGNLSVASNQITVLLNIGKDIQPPSTPTNLWTTAVADTQVSLRWNASTDNVGVVMYEVFANGTQVATSFGSTSATVTGLTPNTAYSFTVKARDAASNESAASAAVSATTTVSSYSLVIAVSGSGTTTPAAGTYKYTAGTAVQVSATPGSGYAFSSWSGAATGSTTPVTVTMNGNKTLTATFASTNYSLTVAKFGTGTGSVSGTGIDCGSTCNGSYAPGTSVTLTANPDPSSTFSGWGGACSGTTTCTVSMSAARTVTAIFNSTTPVSYSVAMVQASAAQASDITQSDIASLVSSAVSQAGGLDFIRDGQTVVLKPNLLFPYNDPSKSVTADPFVNGIDTDWRVVKAVADLVRARNPSGKILVMEGSVAPTATAYSILGYNSANFGTSVDEFIAVEGSACNDASTTALVQRTAPSGKIYWVNSRYVNADVVISLPVLKTHVSAGITGAVKNLGIGMTPVGVFSAGNAATDCTRGQTSTYIDHSTPETLGQFIRDYYSLRPADFVVMDALQGLEHGPLPGWDSSGSYDYTASKKNMRLILASKNAVALDTIAASIMMCDPTKIPMLTKLEADGNGTTNLANIVVVGKQVSEVAKAFAGKLTSICPGPAPTTVTLTLSSSGNGSTSPAAGVYSYTSGTSVAVTAIPGSNSTFLGWSGAATGTTNPITVSMTASKTLTASFSNSNTPGATRPGGGACQAGVSYPAPVLTGTLRQVYKPSGTVSSGTYEGPVWQSSSSSLLFSDVSFTGSVNPAQMLQLSNGTVTTYVADSGTNGMSVDANGTIYAASHKVQGIVKLSSGYAGLATVVSSYNGKTFNSPNDLVVRSDGTIYFTDPDFQLGSRTSQTGVKGVYSVSPTGVVSLVDSTFAEPNGIALSPDETVLYVADYNGNVVRTFSVASDGSTSDRKDFATVTTPDGFGMDCLGNLYVASGNAGLIQVFSPSGTKLGTITAAASVSNIAFGGTTGKTMYITAGKALYSLTMNLPGYNN